MSTTTNKWNLCEACEAADMYPEAMAPFLKLKKPKDQNKSTGGIPVKAIATSTTAFFKSMSRNFTKSIGHALEKSGGGTVGSAIGSKSFGDVVGKAVAKAATEVVEVDKQENKDKKPRGKKKGKVASKNNIEELNEEETRMHGGYQRLSEALDGFVNGQPIITRTNEGPEVEDINGSSEHDDSSDDDCDNCNDENDDDDSDEDNNSGN
ncbi:Aste57867_14468 [Aphanomyces stellatus]|uniref:Aste57867_14468 protein n=1 Tax=Aphanomyces stellatus TaxID=120398 RepID=A0A485L1A6_9STRA|nr:hypothetical protein As57867_014414 [Aphanomyces stellatus]VFT91290.1 Aste57867_14468 [Aphanomyces stellatus]